MGLVYAEIGLSNPRKPELKSIAVRSLVDTGAVMLCIPEHIANQLSLEQNGTRDVSTADGRSHKVPYVGPVKVEFEDRLCFVGALVLGNEPLLGAVPMEDMDLVVHPLSRTVTVNPASPNFPHHIIKTVLAD
jgi:clan AA aspartic protease